VLLAELGILFGSCLFAENCDGWITGNQLDEECDKRDDGPNYQQQNKQAFQDAHRRAS
jgi:hypothetical protein